MMTALYDVGNVDIRYNKDCALRLAAEGGHYLAVKWLVAMGADVQVYDNLCLRMALRNNHLNVAEYLFLKGADLSSHDLCEPVVSTQGVKPYELYSSMGIKLALKAGMRFDKMTYEDYITIKEQRISDVFDLLQAHIGACDFAKRSDVLEKAVSSPKGYQPAKDEMYQKQFACNTRFINSHKISFKDALIYMGDVKGLCDRFRINLCDLEDFLNTKVRPNTEFTIADALYRAGHMDKVFDQSLWHGEPQAESLGEKLYNGMTTAQQKQCSNTYMLFKTQMAEQRLSTQNRARKKTHRPKLG